MDEAQGGRRKRCQDHGPTYLEKPSSLLSGILDVTKAQFSLVLLLCFFPQVQELKEILMRKSRGTKMAGEQEEEDQEKEWAENRSRGKLSPSHGRR